MSSLSNKFSSFIGIILLLAIVCATVYINFFVEEPVEEVKEEEIVEVEETKFSILNETDLALLWKLKNLNTDSISDYKETTYIHISKLKESSDYDRLESSDVYKDFDDSMKQVIKKNYFEERKMVYCGTLKFKNSHDDKKATLFNDVDIKDIDTTHIKSLALLDIGIIFLKYPITSISTKSQIGDYTSIHLADGREIYLIKENTILNGKYYKERLEMAEYLNDSTRVVYPLF